MIDENERVHRRSLKDHDRLGLIGRVVLVGFHDAFPAGFPAGERIVGYTFGFEVSPGMFCVLFEICDLTLSGLPVYIFREFCADAAVVPYRRINVMDDFGMPNVRATKLSFRPSSSLSLYSVTKTNP